MERLEKSVVHEICTNQVVITLHACVKELVENSLDAGATRLELRLRESGSELLELVDNGQGIAEEDYEKLAMRHATSKIGKYEDLSQSLSTFGFRGEALCAICAMGDVTVCTRTASDATAMLLTYDRFGKLTSKVTAAREVGTTVSVRELFKRLPVRHREFLRNAKAQVSATVRLIQAYAVAQPEIKFHMSAEKARGTGMGRTTLLSTPGTARGWRQAVAAALGDQLLVDVQAFELQGESGWKVSGLISTPFGGRRTKDMQLFFINRRPVEPPKRIVKLINDTFHQYNSRMYPLLILAFSASQTQVDVNVTPDKRTVFLHKEEELMVDIQKRLTEIYTGVAGSNPEGAKSGGKAAEAPSRAEAEIEGTSAVGTPFGTQLNIMDMMASSQPRQDTQLPLTLPAATPMEVDLDAGPPDRDSDMRGETEASSAAGLPTLIVEAWEPSEDSPPLQASDGTGYLSTPGPHIAAKSSLTPKKVSQKLNGGTDGSVAEEALPREDELRVMPLELMLPNSQEAESSGDSLPGMEVDTETAAPMNPPVSEQALGMKTSVRITMAELEAAVERRQKHARTSLAGRATVGTATSVQFPSAFSLSSLRGKGGKGSSTLEEVAKFATNVEAGKLLDSGSTAMQFDKSYFSQMRVLGQFNLGFILAALRGGPQGSLQVFIVDQHASDEKFRFEGLNRESKVDKQPLVSPHYLQLTPAQEQLAQSNLEVFRLNGFELSVEESRPPGRRLRLTTLPNCKGLVFDEKDILDLIWKLEETETDADRSTHRDDSARGSEASSGLLDLTAHRALWSATAVPRPPKVWSLLACRACRGAIMVGRALKDTEMERVLCNLGTLQQPWNCPHGRPTMRHLVDTSAAKRVPRRSPPLATLLATRGM